MPFNFHVGLPGPVSYNRRIGGGRGPSSAEQVEQLQVQRALRDLYCPAHLRFANFIGWAAWAITGLVATLITPWALAAWAVFATLTWAAHRSRAQRRAPHLGLLAEGSGCELCAKVEARTTRKAQLDPLGQLHRRR